VEVLFKYRRPNSDLLVPDYDSDSGPGTKAMVEDSPSIRFVNSNRVSLVLFTGVRFRVVVRTNESRSQGAVCFTPF
jgi:hypothetical protein